MLANGWSPIGSCWEWGEDEDPPPSLVTVDKVQMEKLRLGEVQVSPRPHIADVLPQTTHTRPSCALEHAGKSPEGLVSAQILAAGLDWGQMCPLQQAFRVQCSLALSQSYNDLGQQFSTCGS